MQSAFVIDVGNTWIKSGTFQHGDLVGSFRSQSLAEVIGRIPLGCPVIASSVRDLGREAFPSGTLLLNGATPLPLAVDYQTPATLGLDRVAAACGAQLIFEEGNTLVVDAGTCVTYDVLESGIFKGGAISPGLNMRLQSMAHFTDKLPSLGPDWQARHLEEPGTSTADCMLRGAYAGLAAEMNGFINNFLEENPENRVILTGGDLQYFESSIKAPIFADLNLVLRGLYSILNYNQ